jgi:DNA-binding NtrC family response regulator
MRKKTGIVAIFNSTQDIIEIFEECLEQEGFNVVSGYIPEFKRGNKNLLEFMKDHDPDLIIYDIPPPYEQNVNFLKLIQDMSVMEGRKFIYTTTNKAALKKVCGSDYDAIEILGKPIDLDELVSAVKRGLK